MTAVGYRLYAVGEWRVDESKTTEMGAPPADTDRRRLPLKRRQARARVR